MTGRRFEGIWLHSNVSDDSDGSPEHRGLNTRTIGFVLSLLLHAAVLVVFVWARAPHVAEHQSLAWIQLLPPAPAVIPKPEIIHEKILEPVRLKSPTRPKSVSLPLINTDLVAFATPNITPSADAAVSDVTARPLEPPTPESKSSTAPADYAALLAARLEQVKRYPDPARAKRQEGTVMVFFTLEKSGRLIRWHVAHTSGYHLLDAEVAMMMVAASPFPPFPEGMHKAEESFVVPIEFFA